MKVQIGDKFASKTAGYWIEIKELPKGGACGNVYTVDIFKGIKKTSQDLPCSSFILKKYYRPISKPERHHRLTNIFK